MTIEYDDKGKYFTEVISKFPVLALVQTTRHLIRGNVHVRRDERLKDELDHEEAFLAITNASILGDDMQVLHQTPFLAVLRAQIIWVMPVENDTQADRKE